MEKKPHFSLRYFVVGLLLLLAVQALYSLQQASTLLAITMWSSTVPICYEKPCCLAPERGGEKTYVPLREALNKTGKLALALLKKNIDDKQPKKKRAAS